MISRLRGTLLSREGDQVELATVGGVVYEVKVPLSVAERLPGIGEELELRTVQVVREDLTALYGFLEPGERRLFGRLLSAAGVGAGLALAMLSTFPAARLTRALAERDMVALVQVPGIGKKKAERIFLELSDRMDDMEPAVPAGDGEGATAPAREAVQALIALGMSFQEADGAVRAVLADGAPAGTPELIRKALARR
jgi:holliday junction DNA helicase RuvA